MLEFGIYRDCFSSADMRAIWSEHATISAWLKVEQTLARSQAAAELIPAEAATALEAISVSDLNQNQLRDDMALVGRPIVGLVRQLRTLAGEYGRFVHFRATTQDIMDTAVSLQMRHGLEQVRTGVARLIEGLDRHIGLHGSTRMMGRTNGQYAVPIRLETKLQVWRSELVRRLAAISDAAGRGLNAQIGGPVGDLQAYEDGDGHAVKRAVAAALGLHTVEPHWQNSRDGVAEIVTMLGGLCSTLCKIAHNINLLSSSDIGEIYERPEDGKGASSAMAHKKNQRASEFGEAVARLGRQRAEQIGELTLHEHERSGGAWIAEWLVVPESFLLTSGALKWSDRMFRSLVVDDNAMKRSVLIEFQNKQAKPS
ncbi:lyase family protein [Ruegeria lacuscaerulensis]|uniref:lyase family protein n=1 Tax=Ruegeria lacuscaerulensis TaxID=55218 RepID=UPI00147CE6C0|nr:lyase family protein [Ruegeria lacuscaerulensis]